MLIISSITVSSQYKDKERVFVVSLLLFMINVFSLMFFS